MRSLPCVFFLLLGIWVGARGQSNCDILIRNGKIIDGTGNNWFYGDVAVSGGKILDIGRSLPYTSSKVIDAQGLVVAPGFIDVHTHIEGDEEKNPEAASFIYDGVTTVIAGNCGASNLNIGKYLRWVDSIGLSVNVATLVGHNNVRRAVMGRANRPASAAEVKQMETLVDRAMNEGAVGLSTGLIYIPGTYSETSEVVALAKVAATYNRVYASHIRNEGDKVTDAINEAINVGKMAGLPVQISHFKLSGQQNWGRSRETLAMVEKAREEGIDVTIDQYPYTASSTSISTLLPDELLADGQDSVRARLSRPEVRKKASTQMVASLKKRRLKHFSYAVVAYYAPDTSFNGRSIEEINLLMGRKHRARQEAETIMDLQMNGGASGVFHGMGEEDVRRIMQYPFNMFASDASIRVFNEGMPHPRGYGTNARVLGKYVREEKVLRLEEAIRRMTSLPAQKFQLKDRGLLKTGMAADIVIFDEKTVQDKATFQQPHAYSQGFHYVLVNGAITVKNGKHNGTRAGKALYHRR